MTPKANGAAFGRGWISLLFDDRIRDVASDRWLESFSPEESPNTGRRHASWKRGYLGCKSRV